MALTDPNLADAISRARQLDPVALGQIYDVYFPQVYRYAQFRLGEDAQASELSKQVFSHWLETLAKRPSLIDNLDSWFFESARKTVDQELNHSSQASRRDKASQAAHAGSESQVKDGAVWLNRLVSRSLHKLLPDQQHLLALRFAGLFSIEETSRLMGKSIAEIKGIQYDALVALRKLLEAEA